MLEYSSSQQTLAALVQIRERTDFEIPAAWMSMPVASFALWAAVGTLPIRDFLARERLPAVSQISPTLGLLAMAGFAASAASAYLAYSLVNRRNKHFAREQALLWKTLDSVRSRARQDDLKMLLPVSSAERNFSKLTQEEGERSAYLWALLVLVPYLGGLALLYVLAFLTNDLRKHELREDLVLEDLDRSLKALGDQGITRRDRSLASRNVGLYALASVLTLGVFLIYWLYQTIRDPQIHFAYHSRFESALLQALADTSGS